LPRRSELEFLAATPSRSKKFPGTLHATAAAGAFEINELITWQTTPPLMRLSRRYPTGLHNEFRAVWAVATANIKKYQMRRAPPLLQLLPGRQRRRRHATGIRAAQSLTFLKQILPGFSQGAKPPRQQGLLLLPLCGERSIYCYDLGSCDDRGSNLNR
jgi:hypothetical protein